jgi:hypothetical protein
MTRRPLSMPRRVAGGCLVLVVWAGLLGVPGWLLYRALPPPPPVEAAPVAAPGPQVRGTLDDWLGYPSEYHKYHREFMKKKLSEQCAEWNRTPNPSAATVYVPYGLDCNKQQEQPK